MTIYGCVIELYAIETVEHVQAIFKQFSLLFLMGLVSHTIECAWCWIANLKLNFYAKKASAIVMGRDPVDKEKGYIHNLCNDMATECAIW